MRSLGPKTKGGPVLLAADEMRMLNILAGVHGTRPHLMLGTIIRAAFEAESEKLAEQVIER